MTRRALDDALEIALAATRGRNHPDLMAPTELYIRNPSDAEARGPFSLQQVTDLAEAGQVNPETLVHDAASGDWRPISALPELAKAVFPEKKKLSLKPKEVKTLNRLEDAAKPIDVNEMLDAAQGRTEDTKDKMARQKGMELAVRIGGIAAPVTLLVAAVAETIPSLPALISMDTAKIMARPVVFLAVADVILALLLWLGLTSLYPLVRFRAALGLGILGFLAHAQGATAQLVAVAAGSAGLFFSTLALAVVPAVLAATAGIGGMGLLAWLVWSA